MKSLAIITLLALAATQADAGSLDLGLGVGGSRGGKSWRVRVGYSKNRHVATTYRRVRASGHYDLVEREVWVAGYAERVHRPAEYGVRCAHGRRVRFVIRPARYVDVFRPGHYETRRERVWEAGRYELQHHRGGRRVHADRIERIRRRGHDPVNRATRSDRAFRRDRGIGHRASRNDRGFRNHRRDI